VACLVLSFGLDCGLTIWFKVFMTRVVTPKPLITMSTTLIIVVHYVEFSAMYPHVVILSLVDN
jgi:hypothetical protein